MKPLAGSASGRLRRTGARALTLVLIVGAAACGRRGPPLAPEQVDPETPQVLPLRQENGQVVVRWYAPRLDDGGDPANLRLRKAIVSYRIVDLHALAAEERASQRQPPEEADEEEPEEVPPGDEGAAEVAEPEDPETVEETAPDATEPETVEPAAGEETSPPDSEPPEIAEPETEGQPPEGALPGEAPVPEEPPATAEEQPPAGEAPPEEPEPDQAPDTELAQAPDPEQTPATERAHAPDTEPEQEPETESDETQEEPDTGEPAGDETGGEAPAQTPDPEQEPEVEPDEAAEEPDAEPEPTGVLLDYEDLEFEVLSEIESEVLGEERVLELPVEPDWIGRRLEITVRYEARGGASEESELQSLDVTGPLPALREVNVDVGPSGLTVRWQDPRPALEGAPPLTDPVFEAFRRRGAETERLGRSFGLSQTDSDVVWGEEVCYRARLVVAGSEEEGVIPDPGPSLSDGPGGTELAEEAPASDEGGEERAPGTSGVESRDPEGEAVSPPTEPEPEDEPWTPIPIRVPGTGTGALSVGPMSFETCVTPVDVFPPAPPSDLRLFWRTEQTDLSWGESASTDTVGYHVYRSDPDGTGFQRLTESPVEQTSYTDAERDPRGAYRYAITAVDGADPPNESLPSDSQRANPR